MDTHLETTDGSCKFYRVQVNGLKTIVTYVRGRGDRGDRGDRGERGKIERER